MRTHSPSVGVGMKAFDRLLLGAVVFISCLALTSYHRATHRVITLSTTFSQGSGNTTAYIVLSDDEIPSSSQQRQLELKLVSGEQRDPSGQVTQPRVLLRYTACTGLINQQYSHIAAFALASVLRADIMLPPAISRDSFEHYFSMNKTANQVAWTPVPTGSILDVEGISAAWGKAGINVFKAPQLHPFPDMSDPGEAYATFAQQAQQQQWEVAAAARQGGEGGGVRSRPPVARVEGVYLKPRNLHDLVALAREAVRNVTRHNRALQELSEEAGGGGEGGGGGTGRRLVEVLERGGGAGGGEPPPGSGTTQAATGGEVAAQAAAAGQARAVEGQDGEGGEAAGPPPPDVILDLPCTFFSLQTASSLPIVGRVALSLAFNRHLSTLADRVVELITDGGRYPFNGVHLRVEKDAQDWATILGGPGQIWHMYIQSMKAAGFDPGTRLFVASGLLSYRGGDHSAAWLQAVNFLTSRNLASKVHYKEEFLPYWELEDLNSEQRALLDFMILARARRFVGFGSSTFSYYLREYRALKYGIPKSSSLLVNASKIGTDKLFAAAGRVVVDWEEEGRRLSWLRACTGLLWWLKPRCWGGGGLNPRCWSRACLGRAHHRQ